MKKVTQHFSNRDEFLNAKHTRGFIDYIAGLATGNSLKHGYEIVDPRWKNYLIERRNISGPSRDPDVTVKAAPL